MINSACVTAEGPLESPMQSRAVDIDTGSSEVPILWLQGFLGSLGDGC